MLDSDRRAAGVGDAIMHAIALLLLVVVIWPVSYYYAVGHWLPMVLLGYIWAAFWLHFVLPRLRSGVVKTPAGNIQWSFGDRQLREHSERSGPVAGRPDSIQRDPFLAPTSVPGESLLDERFELIRVDYTEVSGRT